MFKLKMQFIILNILQINIMEHGQNLPIII